MTNLDSCGLIVVDSWKLILFRSTLSAAEKGNYIDAVVCLQNKTALTPSSLIAGAKTRYDDFVGTHINQTLNIHYTVRYEHVMWRSSTN